MSEDRSSGAGGPTGDHRIRYVCMPGSPYTGSTLLGLLLNEHPSCVSIGAATGLTRRVDLATYRCSCGRPFVECEFWNEAQRRTKELGHPVNVFETNFWNTHLRLSPNKVVNALLVRSLGVDRLNDLRDRMVGRLGRVDLSVAQMGWNTWSLARAITDMTGKVVFVDTARDHQRPKYLSRHPLLDVKVIHLMRDPRGNSASIMKHTGVDIATASRQWRHYNVEANRVRRYLPADAWMTLYYEDLCSDPKTVLGRIAGFLGVPPMTTPGAMGEQVPHVIGNSMRLRALSDIKEDRSWQSVLGPRDLALIARIAGPTSRRLGFGWP
ncbi:MAG: sulfotransferase [Actinomycetota bacterium]